MVSRRTFIQILSVAGPAATVAALAHAEGVDPACARAKALAYVNDARKTDKAKYPKYIEGQVCGNCQLYEGSAGADSGTCRLFAYRTVSVAGWCREYRRAGNV